MSDQDPLSKPPSKQTSSVPLMKETVRVTLKAADAPPAAPSASMQGQQPSAPTGPPTPAGANEPLSKNTTRVSLPKKATSPQSLPAASAPPAGPPKPAGPPVAGPPKPAGPPAPAKPTPGPTVPLATAPPTATTPLTKTPSAAKPAPTIQLKTAGGGKPGASAPTIRLATSGAPIGAQASPTKSGTQPGLPGAKTTGALPGALPGAAPMAAPAPTRAIGTAGQATLPKATVQLTPPTKPLTAPGGPTGQTMPTFKIDGGYQAPPEPLFVKILSGFGLAASITLVVFQIMQADIWMAAEDNLRREDRKWSQLIE